MQNMLYQNGLLPQVLPKITTVMLAIRHLVFPNFAIIAGTVGKASAVLIHAKHEQCSNMGLQPLFEFVIRVLILLTKREKWIGKNGNKNA